MISNEQLEELGITCQADGKYAYGDFSGLTYDQLLMTLEHWHNTGSQNDNILFASRSLIDLAEQDSQHGENEIEYGDEKLGKEIIVADAKMTQAASNLLMHFRP